MHPVASSKRQIDPEILDGPHPCVGFSFVEPTLLPTMLQVFQGWEESIVLLVLCS